MLVEQRFNSAEFPAHGAPPVETEGPAEPAGTPSRSGVQIRKALRLDPAGGKGKFAEVFTMSLDGETIPLVPLKTWSQLDTFKWRVRGKLPGTPPGLEITPDQVKVAGEIVSIKDPEGPAKLQGVWNAWLAAERRRLEAVAQSATPCDSTPPAAEDEPLSFKVGLDAAGQPHIRCLEGNEVAAEVALTNAGLDRLFTQGLMRKPGTWKIGALRDWIELDGELFKFREDASTVARFEDCLNQR